MLIIWIVSQVAIFFWENATVSRKYVRGIQFPRRRRENIGQLCVVSTRTSCSVCFMWFITDSAQCWRKLLSLLITLCCLELGAVTSCRCGHNAVGVQTKTGREPKQKHEAATVCRLHLLARPYKQPRASISHDSDAPDPICLHSAKHGAKVRHQTMAGSTSGCTSNFLVFCRLVWQCNAKRSNALIKLSLG